MKVKFNILDFLILAVLILGIFIFFNVFGKAGSVNSGSDEELLQYEYIIKLQDVDKELIKDLEKDVAVLDGEKNFYYGTLKDFYFEQSLLISENLEEGTFVETAHPENIDVYLTVTGTGFQDDKGFNIEGQGINVGKRIIPKVKGFTGVGYVVEIGEAK